MPPYNNVNITILFREQANVTQKCNINNKQAFYCDYSCIAKIIIIIIIIMLFIQPKFAHSSKWAVKMGQYQPTTVLCLLFHFTTLRNELGHRCRCLNANNNGNFAPNYYSNYNRDRHHKLYSRKYNIFSRKYIFLNTTCGAD